MIVVGLFYVLMAYVATVGYGINNMTTGYANDSAPFDTISRQFSGDTFAVLIDLAGTLSFFGAALAIINGGARHLYGWARRPLAPLDHAAARHAPDANRRNHRALPLWAGQRHCSGSGADAHRRFWFPGGA